MPGEPSELKIILVSLRAKTFPMRPKTELDKKMVRCKLKLGSDPMRAKIVIGHTHVPKRAKNETELKTVLTRTKK